MSTEVFSACCGSRWKILVKDSPLPDHKEYDVVCVICNRSSGMMIHGFAPTNFKFAEITKDKGGEENDGR